jgi:glycosyltransferase involved in cell wall biosynthesis
MHIAICHGTFSDGDAIGYDMGGMYDSLARIGALPMILCQHLPPGLRGHRQITKLATGLPPQRFDLLIYHHSIYWDMGGALLEAASCPIVFKYHNITPAHFFEPFSAHYAGLCKRGAEQTKKLIRDFPAALWLTDSEFNKSDLIALGLRASRCGVVPPFAPVSAMLKVRGTADYSTGRFYGLFIGRLAPSKGHRLLLDVVARYVSAFSKQFILRVVGSEDPALSEYVRLIKLDIAALGLSKHVEIVGRLSDEDLASLYSSSHVYLNFSEHEGFCVPLVEAQAAGLPVVCVHSGASADTLGPGQLVASLPGSEDELMFFARLIHEVLTNNALREQLVEEGLRNVSGRFLHEIVENRFIAAMAEPLEAHCESPS